MAVIFDQVVTGSGTMGTLLWVDLGLIPTGKRIWFSYCTFTNPTKVISYYIRPNLATKSTGTDTTTLLVAQSAPKAGATATIDLYKNGRLHTTTIYGTGIEHWWLKMTSKSGTSGTYMYKIIYTLE